MREIVLDTETTGLDPASDHRIVEIGCVELINLMPSGRSYHRYVNPERPVPSAAFEVHGLSDDFLAGHPVFAEIAPEFLAFIGDAPLVIHNAAFDIGFLNAELKRCERPPIEVARAIDTVTLARRKFPGAPANLDALCRRFNVDAAARTKHGALLDAELLAEVYLELKGGRQPALVLAPSREAPANGASIPMASGARPPRPHAPSPAEDAAHAALLANLSDPIWTRYRGEAAER